VKKSAGILLYKLTPDGLALLLVHPGGPFFAAKDLGVWSIPKGEYLDEDDPMAAALRELTEETGAVVSADALDPLGSVRQKGGKQVTAWCAEADFDVSTLVSNTFELEWPPGSGVFRETPEVDRGEWYGPEEARAKLNPAQAEFVGRLEELLAERGRLTPTPSVP
jgi:predicted NUDIX family NTP pyrophosphohydrolase